MTPVTQNSPRHAAPLAALWTPRGRGAVATIRVVGDSELWSRLSPRLFCAANGKLLGDQLLGRVVFGRWGADPSEEVVVCRCDDHTLEIHCHGGDAASRRILADLEAAGYWVVTWIDMLTAVEGRLQAECNAVLAKATTFRAAAILLDQQAGMLQQAIVRMLEAVDSASPIDHDKLLSCVDELLQWAEFGLHLTQPWLVVLAGRPNVGKSSLINALVGYSRSIVHSEPGTTRDVVTAETAFDGWPVSLADTAGIRNDADELESAGIERARQVLAQADCRLLLIDTSQYPQADDLRLVSDWPDALVVAHKSDLPDVWGDRLPAGAVRVSSLTKAGVEQLQQAIVERLVPRVPAAGTAIPVAPRQVELLLRAERVLKRRDVAGFGDALRECLGAPGSPEFP